VAHAQYQREGTLHKNAFMVAVVRMMIHKRVGGMQVLVMEMNLVLVERAVVGGNLDGGTGSRNNFHIHPPCWKWLP
jgi:hypothetical protein